MTAAVLQPGVCWTLKVGLHTAVRINLACAHLNYLNRNRFTSGFQDTLLHNQPICHNLNEEIHLDLMWCFYVINVNLGNIVCVI